MKTIEYRRHKGQFNARVFSRVVGCASGIAYHYNINLYPSRTAIVTRFEVAPAGAYPAMLDFYQDCSRAVKSRAFICASTQAHN